MNTLLKGSEYEEKLQLQENFDGIQVIGAGLPRTGTLSTRSALAQLLKGKVYHMNNLAQGEELDYEFWNDLINDGVQKSSKDWISFLKNRGFVATLDNPAAIYYKELLAAFPDAKVLLTVRDPESWYESVKNSIHISNQLSNSFPLTLYTRYIGKDKIMKLITKSAYVPMVKGQSMFGAIEAGKEASIQFYKDWVQEVKTSVPNDKLLVFSVKEGWEPLCEFLKVPIPKNQPFPRVNDTVSLNEFNQKMFMIKYLVNFILIPTAVSAVMMYFYLE